MPLSHVEAVDIAETMRNSLKLQNAIGFGDMAIKAPDIDFYPDSEMYFNSATREIHIGVYGVTDVFHVQDESDFVNALNYVRGHEEQHCRSTASMPYQWGIVRGAQKVLEYISSKEESSKRRFRTDKDYEDFANVFLPSKGIYVSYKMLMNIIGGIANSVEDGRIERIRAGRFPGFENLRIVYRGRFWDDDDTFQPWEKIKTNIPEQLRLIVNQILSLATCQLYQKGFAKVYAGTPLMKEVEALMPDIAAGVMAGRTRDMAKAVVSLSNKLAPYLYQTCKLSDKDAKARKALEAMLADVIKSIVDQMPDTGLSERDEDTDDGGIHSTFPDSDLVVTLDDDTYDKLERNASESKDSGGLMIRREHPKKKEEEKEKESSSTQGAGSSETAQKGEEANKKDSKTKAGPDSENRSAGENGESTSGNEKPDGKKPGSSGSAQNGAGSEEQKENGENGSSESQDGQESGDPMKGAAGAATLTEGELFAEGEPDDKTAEKAQKTDRKEPEQKAGSKADNTAKVSGSENAKAGNGGSKCAGQMIEGHNSDPHGKADKADIDRVKAAMKAAAESARETAKAEIDTVNAHVAHEKTTGRIDVPDTDKSIKPEDVRDICPDFEELKRAYKLTDHLPVALAARGRTLLRKNQQYFKSLSTPNVSYLDSGSIDPSRIYGLAFGATDIFRKKGMDRKFDGCVYILIDNSGSMCGKKRMEACKAAAVIEESFRGLIPIKIVAFDYYGRVIHEVVKGWNEQQRLNCCWNFCLHGRKGGGNADGYDIKIAERELLARPERKKLLIVLSDGMPAEATPGCTKGAINEARKNGIQVNGIYFEEGETIRPSRQFLEMYGTRDGICCPLSELDGNLQKIMKKFSRS